MIAEGRQGIVCAGNWILDVVHDLPHWPDKSDLVHILAQRSGLGGGAANVASDLKAMGAPYPIVPVGLIGTDAMGDRIVSLCRRAGLSTDRIGRTDKAATAHTHVMNVPGDSRTFFYHAGASDLLDAAHIDVPGLAASGARIFYLGYLNLLATLDRVGANGRTGAAAVLAEARLCGMVTCVDLVSSQNETYRQTVAGALPEIDILLLNEVEAARATGLPISDASDTQGMTAAAHALMDGGVHRAVIVHSAVQTVWLEGNQAHVYRPEPVPAENIVSVVGAGDAFAAGVLHGIHEEWARERTIELGFRAAAACLGGQTATDGMEKLSRPLARR